MPFPRRLPSFPPPGLRAAASGLLAGLFIAVAVPAKAQVRVFNNGDSITFGVGASDLATRGYSPVLAELLGSGYSVQRDGTGGATLLRRGQPSFFDTQGILNTRNANPDIITVLLGTNDSKASNWNYRDEFVGDYLSLVDTFRALPGDPDVLLCLPPPATDVANDVRGSVIANQIIPRILEVARRRDLSVVDLHSPFQDNFRALFPDGIHPNDVGHRIIAERLRDAIVSGRALRPVPGPWERSDVGATGLAGADAAEDRTSLLVYGAGGAIGGTGDAFRLVHQPAAGDVEVTARVSAPRNVDPLSSTRGEAAAGVTLREGLAPDARHVSVIVTPGGGVSLRWRDAGGASGGATSLSGLSGPIWLRVRREGNSFTGQYSSNGSDWRQIGAPRNVAMGVVQAGVLANSAANNQLARARFEQVAVRTVTTAPVPPPAENRGRRPRRAWDSNESMPSIGRD